MVLSSSKAHDKKISALLRYLSWRYPSMDEGVVNSNPTFQAADIVTLKKPRWDVLSDKMKYVIQESVDIDDHGKMLLIPILFSFFHCAMSLVRL